MNYTFIYNVNGNAFEDTTAWGNAWDMAVEVAKTSHMPITREVYKGEDFLREEFWDGGCFLNINTLDRHAPYIF